MGTTLVNARLLAHANEGGAVDQNIEFHWGNAPGGGFTETHALGASVWKDLHDDAVADDQSDFETHLEAAVTPTNFTWGSSTGTKVKTAAWKCARQTWAP